MHLCVHAHSGSGLHRESTSTTNRGGIVSPCLQKGLQLASRVVMGSDYSHEPWNRRLPIRSTVITFSKVVTNGRVGLRRCIQDLLLGIFQQRKPRLSGPPKSGLPFPDDYCTLERGRCSNHLSSIFYQKRSSAVLATVDGALRCL